MEHYGYSLAPHFDEDNLPYHPQNTTECITPTRPTIANGFHYGLQHFQSFTQPSSTNTVSDEVVSVRIAADSQMKTGPFDEPSNPTIHISNVKKTTPLTTNGNKISPARSLASLRPLRRKPLPSNAQVIELHHEQHSGEHKTSEPTEIHGLPNRAKSSRQQRQFLDPEQKGAEDSDSDLHTSSDIDVDDIDIDDLADLSPEKLKVVSEAASAFKRTGVASSTSHKLLKATNSASLSSPDTFRNCCEKSGPAARRSGASISFCTRCKAMYCPQHWTEQFLHQGIDSDQHDKTDPRIATWVLNTFETNLSDAEQALRHFFDKSSALWFAAGPDERGISVFRDFERYPALVSRMSNHTRMRRYPAFVSFVGETGAGKSSLIKLLISRFPETPNCQTPVVGCNSDDLTPTSGDVHLYSDPQTFDTSEPILYADCEGLGGGSREPIAAQYNSQHPQDYPERRDSSPEPASSSSTASRSTGREIVWADTPEKSRRDYFVKNLYPRLLYTFSDVVVFVMKNGRTIENVVEQLIVWANAVLEASSNQPVLPHAIIVLNACENSKTELWEMAASTEDLLDKIQRTITTNDNFKRYIEVWERRGVNIQNIRQLLLSYYSSVSVVRVPTKDRLTLVHDQIEKLYDMIRKATRKSLEFKSSVRMKLSSEDLQPYLRSAFKHFCETLDSPFDFVKASHIHCSIPSDFGGNILKLALNIMKQWANRLDGPAIFKELSFFLASCIMLDAVRRGILGLAGPMLRRYVRHFDEALEDFCDRYWPCEYVHQGSRCVNVRAGHSKGHQMEDGRIVQPNALYHSMFTASTYRQQFLDDIFKTLVQLLENLEFLKKSKSMCEKKAAVEIHRTLILKHFYRHVGGAEKFYSSAVCFGCLMFAPQHVLPFCGHIFCTPCIEAFGQRRGQTSIDLDACPLHEIGFNPKWTVSVQPENAGIRVLSLDGGGIRSIMQLATLQQIERELGGHLRVQSFFDLIVGTGGGALIALALGEKNWTVNKFIPKFEAIARAAFVRYRGFRAIIPMLRDGAYSIEGLERLLTTHFGTDCLFGGLKEDIREFEVPRPKVAVTATRSDGVPFVFANYNRPERSNNRQHSAYEFLRAERQEQEMRINEISTAAFAAAKLFKPYLHTASQQSFRDGGIHYGNPIRVATREAELSFPSARNRSPDLVLSIGTGMDMTLSHDALDPGSASTGKPRPWTPTRSDNDLQWADPERTWNKFMDEQEKDRRDCYVRFNFALNGTCPGISSGRKVSEVREIADEDLRRRPAEIKNIAHRLIATSFYFRSVCKTQTPASGPTYLEGSFECRFPSGSQEMAKLAALILRRWKNSYNSQKVTPGPFFRFEERHREHEAVNVRLTHDTLQTMMSEGKFMMEEQRFVISNQLASINISFCLGDEASEQQHFPISGFPRFSDSDNCTTPFPTLSLSRKRAVVVKPQKPEWCTPVLDNPTTLQMYAENHLPGLLSRAEIKKTFRKFTGSHGSPEVERGSSLLDGTAIGDTEPRPGRPNLVADNVRTWLRPLRRDVQCVAPRSELDSHDDADSGPAELGSASHLPNPPPWVHELASPAPTGDDNASDTVSIIPADGNKKTGVEFHELPDSDISTLFSQTTSALLSGSAIYTRNSGGAVSATTLPLPKRGDSDPHALRPMSSTDHFFPTPITQNCRTDSSGPEATQDISPWENDDDDDDDADDDYEDFS